MVGLTEKDMEAVSYSTKVIKSKQITTGVAPYARGNRLYPIVQK